MIRKNIIKNKNDKQRYFLNDSWRIEMPAVVRTPFYGNNCSEYFGYVVTYTHSVHMIKKKKNIVSFWIVSKKITMVYSWP